MTAEPYIERHAPVALSEDEPVSWYDRRGFTRAQARRDFARECCEPLSDFRVLARWMRQPAECPADEHDAWTSHDCICSQIEEGRWFECKRTDPGAIPVWRVEPA